MAGSVELARVGASSELHMKFGLPAKYKLQTVTVNGRATRRGCTRQDAAILMTDTRVHFDVVADFS